MADRSRSLDRITIPAPCNAAWDSMSGNDQVRFCEHCNLHVTDLSSITRYEAMRLVARSQGRLCVRFTQSPSGQILTRTPDKLYRIGRRVSRIAAGAFSATLSLSTAAAQSRSQSPPDAVRSIPAIVNHGSPRETGGNLSGVITDPNGAVISGANVTLVNAQTQAAFTYTTGDDGAYKFSLLETGRYKLFAEAPSFNPTEEPEFELKVDVNRTMDLVLQIPKLTARVEINAGEVEVQVIATMGVVSVREPEEPLVKAAWKNDLAEVARLALNGADVNVIDKATDMSGLDYATESASRDMIDVLLSAGANLKSANAHGETPLMYLRENATVDLARHLLSAGADVNARDESGSTALMRLAAWGGFEVVKELIDAGAKIDVKDDNGNTVLMSAAQNEDTRLLRYLIKAGLPVGAKNQDDETALTIAARSGKADALKALIDAGASLNLQTKDLDDALILAMENDDSGLAKILLDAGADANAKDDKGKTVLMRATQRSPEKVKMLIDAGAELNATDDDGWTALMHAEEVEVVRALVNAGADLTIKNKNGQTALAMARKYEQMEVVKLLESRGAPE